MTIELSNLTFTNKADIVPSSGTEEIINNGIANTLGGKDEITGTGNGVVRFGFLNSSIGTIDTGVGNDTLTGTNIFTDTNTVTGTGGFRNEGGIINTGDGRDTIAGIGGSADGVFSNGTINTGRGNDTITGIGTSTGINFNIGAVINTNDGNDEITGTGQSGIETYDTLNTDNGSDRLIGNGTDGYGILNGGNFKTGAGNDIITGTATTGWGIYNYSGSTIDTDDGNDIITGTSSNNVGIYNDGIINTDSGDDIIDARGGGFGGSGRTLLGDGNDIVQGFGSGSFDGDRGNNDTLELTTGNYTVGISGTTVSFTSDGITMNTSEFEKLIASSTTCDFTGLSNGQTITVT